MKRTKKTITLHSIKRLWKRTGQRSVEVPLITQELIDEITTKPYHAAPMPLRIPTRPPKSNHRLAWATAASILLLIGAGTLWLIRPAVCEKQKQTTVRASNTFGFGKVSELSTVKKTTMPEAKKETARNVKHQQAMNREKHQWHTVATPASSQDVKHDIADIVCYSEGHISDICDEETVITMLLAFL